MMPSKKRMLLALSAATGLLLGACGGSAASSDGGSGGSGGSDEPLVFGTISMESGAFTLPTGYQSIQAYFDEWNARGGVDGRPVELRVCDGALDPMKTSACARELVTRDDVIAMVGSTAYADCPVNGTFYESNDIAAIVPATDATCFESEHLFPYTASAENSMLTGLRWALDTLRPQTISIISGDIPASHVHSDRLAAIAEDAGVQVGSVDYIPIGSVDMTAPILRARDAGADLVIAYYDAQSVGSMLRIADEQGVGIPDGVAWMAPAGDYGASLPEIVGPAGDGLYVNTNFEPLENTDNEAVAALTSAMATHHPETPLDGYAVFGWMAASALEDTLTGIDGDITRESVLAALQGQSSLDLEPLYPETIDFTEVPRTVVPAGKVVALRGGQYVVETEDWIIQEPLS